MERPTLCRMLLAFGLLWLPARAADWPQFRGPTHDGVSAEQGWLEQWPDRGAQVLWKTNVGQGYSGVAISGGRLFTMGHRKPTTPGGTREGIDQIWCLEAGTGTPVWKQTYPSPAGYHYGPLTTPAVDDGLVITLSQIGQLHCFEKSSGKVIWRKSLVDDLHGKKPIYGYACSPLIVGELAVFEAGGQQASLVALDKHTGRLIWRYGRGETGYSSPVSCKLGDRWCVVALTPAAAFGVEASTGREIWRHPWAAQAQSSVTAPLVCGRHVFLSASDTKKTGLLLEVADGTARVVWENQNLISYFNASVCHEGHLYGVHTPDQIPKNASLRCVDLRAGQVRWQQEGFGFGGLTLAGGRLLLLTDKGELVVAEAVPQAYKEIGRAKVLDGNCWNAPVLCAGKVYCRNHLGDLVCVTFGSR